MRVIILINLLFAAACAQAGKIALSFDDAPTYESSVMSGEARTRMLIGKLKKHKVEQAIFFSTTKHINEKTIQRMLAYSHAGHRIANHSHSHLSANKIGVQAYLNDVTKAHDILKPLPGFTPMHRFPFLHHGADQASVNKLQAGLSKLGYGDGYVTVDNAEWYLNHRYVQALEEGKPFNDDAFSKIYVETLWQAIEFYDAIAVKTLGYSPKHVLLLHENDAAALFVGDLIKKIRAEGWQIISVDAAYEEPRLASMPETTFHKQGRIAAIAHARGQPENTLRHPRENTEALDALLKDLENAL